MAARAAVGSTMAWSSAMEEEEEAGGALGLAAEVGEIVVYVYHVER